METATSIVKATLIISHHENDYRSLKEMEGSGSTYYKGPGESCKEVYVVLATCETLKTELAKLKIMIDDCETVKIVAEKFHEELVTMKDGKLAWNDFSIGHPQGLYEIVSM